MFQASSKTDSSNKKNDDSSSTKSNLNNAEMINGYAMAANLGAPAQMMFEEEEEPKQGKLVQMAPEEEELMQGKMNAGSAVQLKEDEELQMKADPVQMLEEEEELQMKTGDNGSQDSVGNSSTTTQMPVAVQSKMENSFGTSFVGVGIHQNDNSATNMGALAYTQGNNVHFAPGQYNPESSKGQELLGHELTHVVQQREGRVSPTRQAKGMSVNDSPALENEADEMGKKAANGATAQMKSSNKNSGASSIQLKSANGVVQLKTEVDSDYGKFKHTKYEAVGTYGAKMELEFHPDKAKVDAEKIGLTQTVIGRLGGNSDIIHPTQKERDVKTGTAKGKRIDRVSSHGNPLYAANKPTTGDNLGDTSTTSFWGQHATKEVNGDWNPAKLKDTPARPGHGNNSSQEFETAALAVEGKQSGLYMGSVKWGWTYKDSPSTFKLIDFDIVSTGDPSSDFFDAASAWNSAHTTGTSFFAKGGLNGGKEAQVYDSSHSASMTVKNNTVVTLIHTNTLYTHIHNNEVYENIEYVDDTGVTQTGLMKMDDLFDKGDGGETIDLPITWTGTVQLDPSIGQVVSLRPGKGTNTGLYADLPVGAKVKVIDDSSAWLKVQVDPNQTGVVLNSSGTSAIGGDGKIIGYVSKELVRK